MRKLSMALVLASAFVVTLGAGAMLTATAQAAPAGSLGPLSTAADSLNLIDQAQYVYRGRRHCWYPNGWNGPGWYRCGYSGRRGAGWGGPAGWNSWVHRGAPVVVVPRGRYYYNGRYYNNRYRRGGVWIYR